MPNLSTQITSLVAAQLGLASVRDDDLLVDDLGAESMDIVNIVAATEERFNVIIDDQAMADVCSVADLQRLVENTIAQ